MIADRIITPAFAMYLMKMYQGGDRGMADRIITQQKMTAEIRRADSLMLQFVAEDSLSSWLIRHGTHSDFSHVDLVTPNFCASGGTEPIELLGARGFAVESADVPWRPKGAIPSGVQWRPLGYRNFSRVVRVQMLVMPQAAALYRSFLLAEQGKPYDWKALGSFAFNRDWRSPEKWFCSELQVAGAEEANVFQVATPANLISPNDNFLLAAAREFSRVWLPTREGFDDHTDWMSAPPRWPLRGEDLRASAA